MMIRNLVTGTALILALAGCGGGGFGGTPVTVAPESYRAISSQPDAAPLTLPGTDGFAIHDKSSTQNPGQSGQAASSADAVPVGTAFCTASAGAGGSSASSFTLGAALHNDSPSSLPVAVTCDIEYEYSLKTTPAGPAGATTGKIAFQLEAREQGTGKLLFLHPLATLSGYEDNIHRSDQQRLQFAASVSPSTRWRIVLQGKVDAQSASQGQAQAELRVTRCQMIIKPLPAQATQPGK